MIPRDAAQRLVDWARMHAVVSVTGPGQSDSFATNEGRAYDTVDDVTVAGIPGRIFAALSTPRWN